MITSIPIWKDNYITLDDGTGLMDSVGYSISSQGREIYSGRAYRKGESQPIEIKLNDIVSQSLRQDIPSSLDAPSLLNTLQIFVGCTDETGGTINRFFRLDWSYNDDFVPDWAGGVLSAPVNGKLSPKQYLPFTKIGDILQTKLTFVSKDGSIKNTIIKEVGDYNYLASIPADTATITINEKITYTISEGCEDYCLYYVNEYGGWDSLLLEGNGIQTDGYRRFTHNKVYDNTNPIARGKVAYLNDITRRYELHTGWLTGNEGERMHHLLGSNLVLLQNLNTNEILPVIITDNECTYRNYHNNGAKLVDYTINVEVARDYKRQ